MKKHCKTIACIILVVCLLLCGCNSNNKEPQQSSDDFWNEVTLSPDIEETFQDYDEVSSQYPDKTVLCWTYEQTMYPTPHTEEVNKYLDNLGSDFAVCFVPIENYVRGSGYSTGLRERIAEGKPVDIIFSEMNYIWESGVFSYYRDCFDNLYLCLDDYLYNTDEGKELYSLFPEKIWDSLKIDGTIYGVDGSFRSISLNYGYLYNEELASKYSYDIDIAPSQQIEKLKEIAEKERITPFLIYRDSIMGIPECTDSKWLMQGIVFDEESKQAICVLDDKEYIKNLREIYTLLQNDLASDTYRTDYFASREVSFVSLENSKAIQLTEHDISVLPTMKNSPKMQTPYMVNAICSQSQHPDEAFKLLSLVMTDRTLNNLLSYGIEGEDYNLTEDGFVDDSYSPLISEMFLSRPISTPNSFQQNKKITSEQYLSTVEAAVKRESLGFAFNAKGFESENKAISEVLMKMSNEAFDYHNILFEEFVEKYRHELKNAGIQSAIDEANRQYELYKEKIKEMSE